MCVFVDGLQLLPRVNILRRCLAMTSKNAASLSNVDHNLAATAAATESSNLDQPDTFTGIMYELFHELQSVIFVQI